MAPVADLLSRLTIAERIIFGLLARLGRWVFRLPVVGRILVVALMLVGFFFLAWLVLLLAT